MKIFLIHCLFLLVFIGPQVLSAEEVASDLNLKDAADSELEFVLETAPGTLSFGDFFYVGMRMKNICDEKQI